MFVSAVPLFYHGLQVADQLGGAQVIAAGWNQGLMHVESNGTGAVDVLEVDFVIR